MFPMQCTRCVALESYAVRQHCCCAATGIWQHSCAVWRVAASTNSGLRGRSETERVKPRPQWLCIGCMVVWCVWYPVVNVWEHTHVLQLRGEEALHTTSALEHL